MAFWRRCLAHQEKQILSRQQEVGPSGSDWRVKGTCWPNSDAFPLPPITGEDLVPKSQGEVSEAAKTEITFFLRHGRALQQLRWQHPESGVSS